MSHWTKRTRTRSRKAMPSRVHAAMARSRLLWLPPTASIEARFDQGFPTSAGLPAAATSTGRPLRSRPSRRKGINPQERRPSSPPTVDPEPIDLDQGERSCVPATSAESRNILLRRLCCAAKCDRRTFQPSMRIKPWQKRRLRRNRPLGQKRASQAGPCAPGRRPRRRYARWPAASNRSAPPSSGPKKVTRSARAR